MSEDTADTRRSYLVKLRHTTHARTLRNHSPSTSRLSNHVTMHKGLVLTLHQHTVNIDLYLTYLTTGENRQLNNIHF